MPLGSSSAAPVIRPGPSLRCQRRMSSILRAPSRAHGDARSAGCGRRECTGKRSIRRATDGGAVRRGPTSARRSASRRERQRQRLQHVAVPGVLDERDERRRAPSLGGHRQRDVPADVSVRVRRRSGTKRPHDVIVHEAHARVFPGLDVGRESAVGQRDVENRTMAIGAARTRAPSPSPRSIRAAAAASSVISARGGFAPAADSAAAPPRSRHSGKSLPWTRTCGV